MTLYIKEPEIIVNFFKYQDTHWIMAHRYCGRCLKNRGRKTSDPLSMMFNSVGERISVHTVAQALDCAELAEEGTETALPSPGTVSFIHSLRLAQPCF